MNGAAVALPALLFAAGAAAQDTPFSPAPTDACLAADPARPADCIKTSTLACIGTLGPDRVMPEVVACIDLGLEEWVGRREAAIAQVVAAETALFEREGADGWNLQDTIGTLEARNRAWELWRDAECAWQSTAWHGGSGGAQGYISCLLDLTGRDALALSLRAAQTRP